MTVVGRGSQMRTLAGARNITDAGCILRIRAGAGRQAQFGRLRGSPGEPEAVPIAIASAGHRSRRKPAVKSMLVSAIGSTIPAGLVRERTHSSTWSILERTISPAAERA